jgi:uncharacterized membrane protein
MTNNPTPPSSAAEVTTMNSSGQTGLPLVRFLDVVLVLLAAPLLLLAGVPALGYAIGAATWILLRALGLAVERHASAGADLAQQLSLWMGYRVARVMVLVAVAVLALKGAGRSDGLTAVLVITVAFTVQLISLVCDRLGR